MSELFSHTLFTLLCMAPRLSERSSVGALFSHFVHPSPPQVYGTPTVRAVISHKWRLYGRQRLTIRALVYAFFTFIFTAFAVIYSKEDRKLTIMVRKGDLMDLTLEEVTISPGGGGEAAWMTFAEGFAHAYFFGVQG